MAIPQYVRQLRQKIGTDLLMVPAVSALVFNDAGELLLQRASSDGKWYLTGGAIDPGEQPADAAAREILEETGLVVEPYRMIGVMMEPPVKYANGDEVQYIVTGFVCRIVGGVLAISDDESLELKYFKPTELPPLIPPHAERIRQAMSRKSGLFMFRGNWRESA